MLGNEFNSYLKKFNIIKNAESTYDMLIEFRDSYEFDHITYHLSRNISKQMDSPYVKTTYPDAWVTRYLMKNYVELDPVIFEGFTRRLPFHWHEIEIKADATIQAFLCDAQSYGIPTKGYSIPLVDKFNRRALISICSSKPDDDWRQMVREYCSEWQELAYIIHQRAIKEVYGKDDLSPSLSQREVECLYWTALGKDYLDIALLLNISGHTARSYLKSARFKLESATLSSAVSKAIQLDIINPKFH